MAKNISEEKKAARKAKRKAAKLAKQNIPTGVKVGAVVAYGREGHFRVSSLRAGKVNLRSVFGKTIYFKGVPASEVREDEAAWYEGWTKSETYMCM